MAEIEKSDCNLNISRYISTAVGEAGIDLAATHDDLTKIDAAIRAATATYNEFLKELGLPQLP
jgi:type I restriction enzyme M protein